METNEIREWHIERLSEMISALSVVSKAENRWKIHLATDTNDK